MERFAALARRARDAVPVRGELLLTVESPSSRDDRGADSIEPRPAAPVRDVPRQAPGLGSYQEWGRHVASADRSQTDRNARPGPGMAPSDDADPPVRGTGRDDVSETEDRRLLPPVQRPGTGRRRLDRRAA